MISNYVLSFARNSDYDESECSTIKYATVKVFYIFLFVHTNKISNNSTLLLFPQPHMIVNVLVR